MSNRTQSTILRSRSEAMVRAMARMTVFGYLVIGQEFREATQLDAYNSVVERLY